MPFELPRLPYSTDALEPHIGAATLKIHHDMHHRAYVDKTNLLVSGTEYAQHTLKEVIVATAVPKKTEALFNNAAQAWNHAFYWNSMSPGGGGRPRGAIAHRLTSDFGSFSAFHDAFNKAATDHFASGWAWLVLDDRHLRIITTTNADTPIAHGQVAILGLDLWEHAYYLDYRNRRAAYVEKFLGKLVNWDFAGSNYEWAAERQVA